MMIAAPRAPSNIARMPSARKPVLGTYGRTPGFDPRLVDPRVARAAVEAARQRSPVPPVMGACGQYQGQGALEKWQQAQAAQAALAQGYPQVQGPFAPPPGFCDPDPTCGLQMGFGLGLASEYPTDGVIPAGATGTINMRIPWSGFLDSFTAVSDNADLFELLRLEYNGVPIIMPAAGGAGQIGGIPFRTIQQNATKALLLNSRRVSTNGTLTMLVQNVSSGSSGRPRGEFQGRFTMGA